MSTYGTFPNPDEITNLCVPTAAVPLINDSTSPVDYSSIHFYSRYIRDVEQQKYFTLRGGYFFFVCFIAT